MTPTAILIEMASSRGLARTNRLDLLTITSPFTQGTMWGWEQTALVDGNYRMSDLNTVKVKVSTVIGHAVANADE